MHIQWPLSQTCPLKNTDQTIFESFSWFNSTIKADKTYKVCLYCYLGMSSEPVAYCFDVSSFKLLMNYLNPSNQRRKIGQSL